MQQKLNQSVSCFNKYRYRSPITTSLDYRISVEQLEKVFNQLCKFTEHNKHFTYYDSDHYKELLIQEIYNSIQLYNSLNEIDDSDIINPLEFQEKSLGKILNANSLNLEKKWELALYTILENSLGAVRNFCTIVSEMIIKIIDNKASDKDVSSHFSLFSFYTGKPSLEFKIAYLLDQKTNKSDKINYPPEKPMKRFSSPFLLEPSSEEFTQIRLIKSFIESDINEILILCRTLDNFTNRKEAKFTSQQLFKLKRRIINTVEFLLEL